MKWVLFTGPDLWSPTLCPNLQSFHTQQALSFLNIVHSKQWAAPALKVDSKCPEETQPSSSLRWSGNPASRWIMGQAQGLPSQFSHPASGRDADLVHQNHRRLMMLKAYLKIQVLKLMVPKGTAREPQRSGRGVGARVARKGSFQEEEVGKSVKCHRKDSERRAWPLGGRCSAWAAFGEAGVEALGWVDADEQKGGASCCHLWGGALGGGLPPGGVR